MGYTGDLLDDTSQFFFGSDSGDLYEIFMNFTVAPCLSIGHANVRQIHSGLKSEKSANDKIATFIRMEWPRACRAKKFCSNKIDFSL